MCRWMGSHFHDWTDHNGVTFLVDNRWMLSFSSILDEIVKVLLRPYTTVKLMLKSF